MSNPWRTTPLPKGWHRIRRRIIRRDGGVCQIQYPRICTMRATECDHIIPVSRNGTDDESNLQAACQPCHSRKTGVEARGGSRKREAEAHPGATR